VSAQTIFRLDTIKSQTEPVPSNIQIDEKVKLNWGLITPFMPSSFDLRFDLSPWGVQPTPPDSNYLLIRRDSIGDWKIANKADSLSQSDSSVYFFNNLTFNQPFTFYTVSVATQNIAQSPLPVKLTYFKISQQNQAWVFKWRAETQTRNRKFELQLTRDESSSWKTIGNYSGHGTSTVPHEWHTTIPIRDNCDPCYFRLKQIDYNGDYEIYGPIAYNTHNSDRSSPSKNLFVPGIGTVKVINGNLIKKVK
jgi:hypothetical protein